MPGQENGNSAAGPDGSVQQVSELLDRLVLGSKDDPAELGYTVAVTGIAALEQANVTARLQTAMNDLSNPTAREGALLAIKGLIANVGKAAEPYVVPLIQVILERVSDKVSPVRDAAQAASTAVGSALCQHAVPLIMPVLYEAMTARNWQTKEAALKLLKQFVETAPSQVAASLPEIVPTAGECLIDPREQVKKAAWTAMSAAFKLNGNKDIAPCVPAMLSCIAHPNEVGDTITKLSATTFVQSVEAPALAIMVPLLIRGMRHGETPIKRKTCVIIANMAKLVNNPADATVFLPRLLPGLKQLSEEVADPECREVAGHSHMTLLRIETEAEEVVHGQKNVESVTKESLLVKLREVISITVALDTSATATLEYISTLAVNLIKAKNYKLEDWKECVAAYLEPLMPPTEADKVAREFRRRCEEDSRSKDEIDNYDDGPGEELANCEFSLAYGGKILLNNARLVLKRGRRYGLCGANGAGKSTLMKAIAAGKVDGFPPADKLLTVYVEHDIQASLEELTAVSFILHDPKLKNLPKEQVVSALSEVGFTDAMQDRLITELSGGWKMKLALARAMLLNADILLLDEPTNHLDHANVSWLETYLTTKANVTCMIVSHDSGFLDTCCTDIYHYENRRLKLYRGNLSEFVKVKPEAQSYYQLAAAALRFKFPEPAPLDGVTSREKSILKMVKAGFTYPGGAKKALTDISLHVRLSSRVAVVGANGAGKSTLIKLLTAEMKPQDGKVDRHPNLRLAYVAQHAFHHLEESLDISPVRYILRRYLGGEDKEEASKVHRNMTPEEWEKVRKQVWIIDKQNRILDKIVGRRKKRRSYEYEIAWVGLSSIAFNRWIPKEELVEKGFEKLVNEYDGKLASEQKVGETTRPLTQVSIEEFLRDFGLDPEFATHSNIRGLSGGQKVKLVLAAAMWSNPHLLIMDEPTNYLDRESLGALALAIREWNGGVVVISHHAEFTSAVCTETWTVADGRLTITKADTLKEVPADDE
ncbi:hypothetical protein CEUSTIGMA_g5482.t1 [Chlamydomonas eustigma]|uniref:Elongation factor 3 n=1 Tax=Chlamydomonas eustigma TaxID=1157962 RepID=A0A250X5K5_9CHLO|nr:hypothetical protein CEUSTIGMA_g5482.t1 [Chlamydomonas eustigma]|eukprot:GAX78040.1 hypothetical protein CEUSTIGMA_g5482.t1 [Chlamydomonas eustigma]